MTKVPKKVWKQTSYVKDDFSGKKDSMGQYDSTQAGKVWKPTSYVKDDFKDKNDSVS